MKGAELEQDLASFHPASYGWALACCRGDRDAAEDVLQTAYLRALEGRARFNGHASSRTWFFGVVKLVAAERRRRLLTRVSALGRWVEGRPADAPEPTPEAVSADVESSRRLRVLLGRLSTRQRDLLHLVFYQELTVEQAAEVLGISPGSARTHYKRGKARLKTMLSGARSST